MIDLEHQNAAIRAYCEAHGYSFKPWQPLPWETTTPERPAWAIGSLWAAEWPKVYRLRMKILADLMMPAEDPRKAKGNARRGRGAGPRPWET